MPEANEPRPMSAHVTITLPIELLSRIDDIRGYCPRSEWIRTAAIERIERLDREPADENGGAS